MKTFIQEVAEKLESINAVINDGRGSSVCRNVLQSIRMNDWAGAQVIGDIDFDKVRQYQPLADAFMEFGLATQVDFPDLRVTTCCHGTPALQLENASPELHALLRRVVGCNWVNDPAYKVRNDAGAFFQGGSNLTEGWALIEFWRPEGAQAFVNFIAKEWLKEQSEISHS